MTPKKQILLVPLFFLAAAMAGCDRSTYAGSSPNSKNQDSENSHNHGTEGDDHGMGHDNGSSGHDHGEDHKRGSVDHQPEDEHDHGHGENEELEPISVTLFTPKVQLFMEYPHLVKGEQAEFLVHVTVLATGEPVRAGTLTLDLTLPEGNRVSETIEAPIRDGLFVPRRVFNVEGRYPLHLTLNSPQVDEVIDVGELIVHADACSALYAAEAKKKADAPDLVQFLLEQQWKLGVRYGQATRRTLAHHLQIPGEITAPQGASAVVSPPVSGRLLPPPSSKLPHIGDHVEAGQLLALVEPPLTVTIELALRSLELEVNSLEAKRSSLQAKARLEFAKRNHERETKLRQKGVGTDQRYEQAEQDLALAGAEYASALAAESHYEIALKKIVEMRAGMQPPDDDGTEYGSALSLPLRAPVSGCIVTASHVEGEHIDAMQEVYRIVALNKVWIVASISEFDLAKLAESPDAFMSLPAYPGKLFEILGSAGARLQSIGTVVDPESRTVPIRYEMPNPDSLLRAGMLADVYLETKRATDCITIPKEAIVLDNGRPTAFVLFDGEHFQRRELELGVRDSGWVEVKSGVFEGERVVTKGAYAIKLASLAPASFGHGHGH